MSPSNPYIDPFFQSVLAEIVLRGSAWWTAAIIALAIIGPLTWISWRGPNQTDDARILPRLFRLLALLLLALALLDPRWTSERPTKGENIVAILADNSSGLQLVDTGEERSRGELAQAVLQGDQTRWMAELAETFQLRFYQFDDDLKRVRDFSDLNFQGPRSDLASALKKLDERYENQPLAGIVLLTDGLATDVSPAQPTPLAGAPVYAVPLGADQGLADARVDRLEARQNPFDDSPVTISAQIVANDLPPETARSLRIKPLETSAGFSPRDEDLPPEQRIRFPPGASERKLEFSWRPFGTGIQFFELGLEPSISSVDQAPQNDRRLFMLDRGEEQFRILYVSGRPNWEFKFLNRSLAPDPQLDMVALMRIARREPKFEFLGRAGESNNPLYRGFGEGEERYDQPVIIRLNTRDEEELRGGFPSSPEELFEYDAIVIDDLESDFFDYNQLSLIRRFVSERGGGLLILGGADALETGGYRETPLAAAIPLYLDRLSNQVPGDRLEWKLTREGWVEPWTRIQPNETLEDERLADMPRFKVIHPLPRLKPGARALVAIEDEKGKTYPGVVAQNFGLGKSACITIGDLWRWGMQNDESRADLAKQWRQIVRWLVTDVPQQVEARAERTSDDAIEIQVTARDAAFHPVSLGKAEITIKRREPDPEATVDSANESQLGHSPGFTQTTVEAFPVSNSPGLFTATFSGKDPGAYLAQVTVLDPEGVIVGEAETGWVEEGAWNEFQRLQPDRAFLDRLSKQTGGSLLELDELDSLASKVSANPAPITETYATPIWHQSWFFLLILICLLLEWALRRKGGLA